MPRQQNPALKNITGHLGHDGAQALLRGLDDYLDSGGSLNQLAAFIYGQDMRTKDGHHTVRRTGTGLEVQTTETEPPAPTRCTWEGTDAEDPEGAPSRRCMLDQGHPTLNNGRPHLLERWHPAEPQPAPIRFTIGADEEPSQLERIPTYPNCATCDGGGCWDCS